MRTLKSGLTHSTKYTDAIGRQISTLISKGNDIIDSVKSAKIGTATHYKWLQIFPEYRELIEQACADAVIVRINRINQAAKRGDWRADAWWLERRKPEQFADKSRIDVRALVANLSDEELLERLSILSSKYVEEHGHRISPLPSGIEEKETLPAGVSEI